MVSSPSLMYHFSLLSINVMVNEKKKVKQMQRKGEDSNGPSTYEGDS